MHCEWLEVCLDDQIEFLVVFTQLFFLHIVPTGDFFNQGEVEMKKSSIFKLEKILFSLSGQVVQLSRYTFFGFVDLNGLGVGWGRGTNPKRQFFCQK